MNNRLKLTALLALLPALVWAAGASAEFMAGAASADITPEVQNMRVPSKGYGDRGRKPMEGVHDPVHCKALVTSDGKEKAALVTCDLIGISGDLRRLVIGRIEGTDIDDHNLMMTASHTHSGPGAMQKNFIAGLVFGRYNDKLARKTADRIAAAIKQADQNMAPARLSAARTSVENVTRNRRDPAGSYNYDTRRFNGLYDPENPENLIDPALTLLKVDKKDGTPIAVVVSFATHGTVMGPDNMQISADWAGAMQRIIEEKVPGAVAMYVNGAEGDQAPAMDVDGPGDWEYLETIGGRVAGGAMRAMKKAEPVSAEPVVAVMEWRKTPPSNKVMGVTVPKSLVRYYFPEMPLQVIRMGDVVIMGVPLEMVSKMGWIMKEGASGQGVRYPIVAGLANEIFLYCATPDEFEQGGYEVENTIFGKMESGWVIGEQMLLVRRVMKD